ncbi:MAG: hypothetical protein E6K95_03115 [Thaumarchaeota archaeon]|nr:MAG: hypothetical protein E6K95_03115 [Nitrososphaerota archaeon]
MPNRISYKGIGLRYRLDPILEPVIRVKPGESLTAEIQDASSGQVRRETDVRDKTKIPFGNPVVGPVYVDGAEAGDSISVSIARIDSLEGVAAAYFSDFNEQYVAGTSIVKFSSGSLRGKVVVGRVEGKEINLTNGLRIPFRPMLGVIGVAPHPEYESTSSTAPPGPHGGNMDLREIGPESKVSLPVYHRGALLYLGDPHAAQSDGEITGTGMEMSATVEVKIDLNKGAKINWPRVETEEEIISVCAASAGRTLKEAIVEAYLQLSLWIEERYRMSRYEAFTFCGQTGRIIIGNLWTAAAGIEKKNLVQRASK